MLKIALSLSGGGFRATLFHLGVVRALREHRLVDTNTSLLHCVTHISSVSGGSIIAAHFALNKEKYLGTDEQFNQVTHELIQLVRKDVRGHIVRYVPVLLVRRILIRLLSFFTRRILPPSKQNAILFMLEKATTSYRAERKFDAFYDSKTLSDFPDDPQIFLLGTNVQDRCLCAFTKQGFEADTFSKKPPAKSGGIPVAQAVAASASFPVLFRPVNLDRAQVASDGILHQVSDAGIWDNLGVSKLEAVAKEEKLDFVLISDATKGVKTGAKTVATFLSNLFLSVDLAHYRSKQLQEKQCTEFIVGQPNTTNTKYIYCRISEDQIATEPKIAVECQRRIKLIRTDFDSFDCDEIRQLVFHGHSVAWHKLKDTIVTLGFAQQTAAFTWTDTWPISNSKFHQRRSKETATAAIESALIRGAEHRWRMFSLRDTDTLLHIGIIAIVLWVAWHVPYFITVKLPSTATGLDMESSP